MVAVIVAADAHCDVGSESPPHRAEAMPVISAADGVGALRCRRGMNAHAAVIIVMWARCRIAPKRCRCSVQPTVSGHCGAAAEA